MRRGRLSTALCASWLDGVVQASGIHFQAKHLVYVRSTLVARVDRKSIILLESDHRR